MRDVRGWPVPEQIKYYAARDAFAHRHELCPIPHETANGVRERITWGRWFEISFGLTLEQYQQQIAEREK